MTTAAATDSATDSAASPSLPRGAAEGDALAQAAEHGRICALSAEVQRDLQQAAEAYPELFTGRPFDATLFGAVALANAFGSPDDRADDVAVAARTSLWIFALDWQIDYLAEERATVDRIVAECLAAADGTDDDATPLTRFLADLRDRLAAAPAFERLRPVWRDELARMLRAMAREWEWKHGAARPSFQEYLDNADNFGSSLVNVSHWIVTGDAAAFDRLDALREASDEVQRVLRLLNDLATYHRDVNWGDLNALLLPGVERSTVTREIGERIDRSRRLLAPLREACPREVRYLERQIGYSLGFYGGTDYWGEL
ncbi:hypothetical protein Arub01_41210 [Actinomadura rubrobrunea]|uniref:Terpene synthase n=1 Tax=Actinomadura rubrobrunea TaxID=115335 RepID=A0A9W6Q049_9ACTN|nr:terpene synthase family protein [Actinomadura rubrobrunea]GLW65877.1 hypothetical protein Arub01_41210 [Actinomadura rubrobrunea]